MPSTKPNFTLLIMGMALLYQGVDSYWHGEGPPGATPWLSLLYITSGMGMCFVAMSFWGDEKPSHTKYHERRETPVHIESITTGGSFEAILAEREQEKLVSLIRGGKIMEALKLYRDSTGHSLQDAKNYIDRVIEKENLR